MIKSATLPANHLLCYCATPKAFPSWKAFFCTERAGCSRWLWAVFYSRAMQSAHLTAHLHHCRCEAIWLFDAGRGTAACAGKVRTARLQREAQVSHSFDTSTFAPASYPATGLPAESHLCRPTWQTQGTVMIDVHECVFRFHRSAKTPTLMNQLLALLDAEQVERHAQPRGSRSEPISAPGCAVT